MRGVSVSTANLPKPRAGLHKLWRPRSMPSSLRSPVEPSPASIKLSGCRIGCRVREFSVPSLDRKTIGKLLEKAELAPAVRRVLELRLGGAQAAVKKIDALLARAGADDRVRGAFRYHGASTGRWAGEGFQPQNLKRPVVEDLAAAIEAVATGDYQHVKKLYTQPLSVIGDCSRPMIIAAPKK